MGELIVSFFKDKSALDLLPFLFSWQMSIIIGLGVLITLFAPDNVLTRYRAIAVFVEWMGGWISPIAAYRRASKFPEIAGLYFSVMFIVTPLIMIHLFSRIDLILRDAASAFDRKPLLSYFSAMILIFIAGAMPFMLYVWADGAEIIPSIPINSSKLALGIFGWLAAGGIAWILIPYGVGVLIVAIKRLFNINSRG